ncbi:unnamed protein product [Lampetra planeri]
MKTDEGRMSAVAAVTTLWAVAMGTPPPSPDVRGRVPNIWNPELGGHDNPCLAACPDTWTPRGALLHLSTVGRCSDAR